jgi:2-(1,2-epoxy-1,2-dihydrophenyl)acetyl-CoA isomerase
MAETIRVVREGGLVEIVLNRPDKLNSINRLMISELRQALEEATEARARALLLRGEGRAFSAGRDLAEADPENEDAAEILRSLFAPLLTQIYEFRAPTIAAVQGACMGAGLGLAFACDIVIAADDAQISSPFGRLGAVLDSGGHFHFARLLGRPSRARAYLHRTPAERPRGGGARAGEPLGRAG